MSAPANTPPIRTRRRGTVEVYFLLYLSAIILLLGTTEGHNDSEDLQDNMFLELLAPGFRVEAEKPALVWRFVPAGVSRDSATAMPLEQDSTNIITAFGTVDDLRFAIVEIEDTLSGSSLPSEAATLTRIGERSAVFRWQPDVAEALENRVYRVTVSATGRPIPPRDLRPETRRHILSILERGGTVSDSVTFTVNLLSINSRGNGLVVETPTLRRPGDDSIPVIRDTVRLAAPPTPAVLPAFDIQVDALDLEAAPGTTWRNRVTVTEPTGSDISWSVSPSSVTLVQSSARGITLGGTVPPSGDQPVTITATRTTDGARATAGFRVTRKGDDNMKIPTTLYVDQDYSFDIGGTTGSGASEVLVLLNGNPYGRFQQRTIPFAPKETGQVKFVRFVNGEEKVSRTANVESLPTPSIHIDQILDDEVIVRTVCFGKVKNRPNSPSLPNSVDLKIERGNATDPEELVAQRRQNSNESATEHIQYWRIRRKESGAFAFRMYAIDRRGSGNGKSGIESFSR